MTHPASICVFCGSKEGGDQAFRQVTLTFATLLVENGVRLIYGGGGIGLMGALADQVIADGGAVTGVIPDFLMRYEVGHSGITDMEVVDSMHARKARMAELADAFVMLPGGIGTLDEAIEIITWKQLRLHDKPIIVLNQGGYWQPFEALIQATIDGGFAHEKVTDLYSVVTAVEDILPAIAAHPAPDDVVLTSHL